MNNFELFGTALTMQINKKKELIAVDNREAEEVNLTGYEITAIESEVFKCKKLTRLIVGEGVRVIGEECFFGCPLEELELPRSLTKVGAKAFWGIRTNFVKYSGTIDDWFEVIRNSGFDFFGGTVILQCADGDLSFGPLAYDQ